MPRRYADYPMQFDDFNMWASIGAFGFGLMQVFFFAVALPMLRGKGEPASQKPWEGAEGLEWRFHHPRLAPTPVSSAVFFSLSDEKANDDKQHGLDG